MIFYLTQVTLDIIGGASWWILRKTTSAIKSRVWPQDKDEEDINKKLDDLTEEIKRQHEMIIELSSMLKRIDHQ